jgi:hypothetical protein
MITRKCKQCKQEKVFSEFSRCGYIHKNGQRSLRTICNQCRRENYQKIHPPVIPQTEKDRQLRAAFGVTEQEYLDLLSKQNGVCAICKQPEIVKRLGKLKALAVDHSHKTDKNRGLLCQRCNIAIGLLQDSPELLITAAQYLKSFE